MAEDPVEFYSRGADTFAENNSLGDMPQEYLELLRKFCDLTGSGKILDAGCGHGRDTEFFTGNGLEAVGVDLAEKMIEKARERKSADFRLMDIRDLDFEDEQFDGVWCNNVIIFFPYDEMPQVISELYRILKPGGLFFISFKLGDGELEREKYGGTVKQHLVSRERARELLESEGLEIVETCMGETTGGFDVLDVFCRK